MPTLAHPFRVLRRAYKLAQETVSQHPAASFTVRDYFPEAVKVIDEEEMRARDPLGTKAENFGRPVRGIREDLERLRVKGKQAIYGFDPYHGKRVEPLPPAMPPLAPGRRAEVALERAERTDRARHVLCRWLAEVTGKDSHQIAAAAWHAESIDEPLPGFFGGVGGHVTNPSMEGKTTRRSVSASSVEPLREGELAGVMDGPEMMPNSGEQVGPSAAKGGGWAFGKGAEAPCYEDDDPEQIGPECFRGSDFD